MVTNFFKINCPFDEFDVQRTAYSDELLRTLRSTHNQNASFFKNDEHIYISPKKGIDLELGEDVRLAVEQNIKVIEQLIRHLIFRTFRDNFPDRVPEDFAPLRFPSQKPQHDLIRSRVPDDLKGVITYSRVNEIHVRSVIENNKPLFGLLISSRHRWRFPINIKDLISQGFNVVGCTVLESVPIEGLKGVLAPDESVLGEIVAVRGEHAVLKTNQSMETRPLSELHLQRTREQIGKYLAFRLGETGANRLFRHLREDSEEDSRPGKHFTEIKRVAEWFAKQTYENNDGFVFSVTQDSNLTDSGIKLEPTNLVFDYGPGASASRPLGGLARFGPFDSSRFDCKQPRFLAIFHEGNRGAATQFLAQLIEGIPSSSFFKKGFKELFRLHDVQYELKEVRASLPEEYERAIDEALRGGKKFDLALVECRDDSYVIPVGHNPYYRAKAKLMSYGIPVQCIRESHLRKTTSELGWTLGPIALQIYAKLGGVPWLLPGSQSVDAELIVGIGSTIQRPNLWSGAEQSRIVGLTTFFLGDGRYIMGNELRSVPYAEYFHELLKSLEESLKFVSSEYGWKEGKTVRIVFHVFKPLKYMEVEIVEQLVARFSQYKIIFAFVTVSTKHPWMMYQNVSEIHGRTQVALCERGANLVLDKYSCLLQSKGEADRPNKKHRAPRPVLIKIHEKSTYADLPFISQQILDFSYLCWRSFFPVETPVTTFYSSIMADLSNKLQKVEGWNPTFLDQHFRRKAWFL